MIRGILVIHGIGEQKKGDFLRDVVGPLARYLESKGGKVDTKVTVDTDFLVLGRKESEEAPPLEERDAYRKAQLYNVQIIGFDELRTYLEP